MRWLALLLFVLTLQPALAQVRDPESHFFMSSLGDMQDELASARKEGKQGVLLMFEMDDCPFCARMKATVLNRSEVQDWYQQRFRIFSMDVKGDTEMNDFQGKPTTAKAFALANRARATPTFLFFDLDGRATARFTGATQSPEEFMLLGRYVVDGAWKSQPFNVYKRQAVKP